MLAATTSINGRLGAGNTDAVALFAQLMPTLAANIATAIEFVYDRVPTLLGSTFAAIVLLFHCRDKLKQFETRLFAVLCSAGFRYSDFQKFSLEGSAISHLLLRELRGEVLKKLQKKRPAHSLPGCAVSAPRLPKSRSGDWEPAHYARQDACASPRTVRRRFNSSGRPSNRYTTKLTPYLTTLEPRTSATSPQPRWA